MRKLSLLLTAIILFSCGKNSTTTNIVESSEKAGFLISSTTDPINKSSVVVTISSNQLLDPSPSVSFAARNPNNQSNNLTQWTFSSIPTDTTLSYSIIWKSDTLTDSITIPPMIDSLFIDTQYATPSKQITISNNAIFRWTTHIRPTGYYVSFTGVSPINAIFDSLNADTVQLYRSGSYAISISAAGSRPAQPGKEPNTSSANMYAFYSLSGPTLTYYFTVIGE